jgi:hypothetical protein
MSLPFQKDKTEKVELVRAEIEAGGERRKGNVEETLGKEIKNAISEH